MKVCIIVLAMVAVVLAVEDKEVTVVRSDSEVLTDGYKFSYETSDGSAREESAYLKNPGTEDEAISVKGSIRWVAPTGEVFMLNYVADENGFQPEGEHLPKA